MATHRAMSQFFGSANPTAFGGHKLFGPAKRGAGAAPASGWTAHVSGVISDLLAVGYGQGRWIAGGNSVDGANPPAQLVTSTDGSTWTVEATPPATLLVANAIGNNGSLWICAGYEPTNGDLQIYSSVNGTAWTERLNTADTNFLSGAQVVFANNLWLLVNTSGSGSGYYTSVDGLTWNAQAAPVACAGWDGVCVDATGFTALWVPSVGTTSLIAHSLDGVTWTTQNANVLRSDHISGRGIATQAGIYVAEQFNNAGLSQSVETATVLSPWNGAGHLISPPLAANAICECITAGPTQSGGNLFIIGSDADKLITSADGVTWVLEDPKFALTASILALAPGLNGSGQKIFVAVGSAGNLSSRL